MSASILDLPSPAPGTRIAYGADPHQFGELHLPAGPGPHPAVIFLHGGFWRAKYDLAHTRHFCAALAHAGLAAWNLEYRRTGHPGGGYPGTLDDVRAGAIHLRQLPALDPARVVVAGHSAGGHLALWLAAQNALPLRAVIALAAVTDLRRAEALHLSDDAVSAFFAGAAPDPRANPVDLLPLAVPQRLLHGTEDSEIPVDFSRAFAARSKNALFVSLEGAGHYELIDPRAPQWPTLLHHLRAPLL